MENKQPSPISNLTEAQRFDSFVTHVTDYAIYLLTPEGTVSSWNAGAQRFKGYTPDEIIGQHFSVFYVPEEQAAGKPARALSIALREGKYEEEGWRQRKDGTRFWASVVIDPIRNDNGDLVGFAKVTRDITERKEAAEALQKAKEALFQAQKLEAIGKLTGGIAHDFNNLIGVIVSGLELFADKLTTPAEVKILESMQRASNRAATLTQQLLSFARRQPLKRDRYNVSRVILSFEAVLRRATNSNVHFELNLNDQLPDVLIDSTQFEAAMLNLVSNAQDAMEAGGKLCIVTALAQLQEGQVGALPAGDYVRVSVSDNGSGMAPDVAAHAIEPFFTTKPVGRGTGLGLSQVYGLIQQSDGDLRIDSEPGKGTTIDLYLPALSPLPKGESSKPAEAVREKALVVDDQPDVLSMAVELFRYMGYEVFSANNAEDALNILRRTPNIDVLFTDVVMPGMNGIELSKKSRELAPGIKILLTSGYPAPAVSSQDWTPEYPFLAKPYRLPEIMKALRTAG